MLIRLEKNTGARSLDERKKAVFWWRKGEARGKGSVRHHCEKMGGKKWRKIVRRAEKKRDCFQIEKKKQSREKWFDPQNSRVRRK